jgi:hypothetical protein
MKFVLVIAFLTINIAIAEEVSTECPMMKELNERTNPKDKASLEKSKEKVKVQTTKQ